ncbi:hypothetical protein KZZ20_00930 [Methylacidiphilum fumariolicum]|uniref:hypothetical protein n=1 Tax=Candidatus Methylacidiphilum fumarolicum TaxID=591154 RepID=UPI00141BA6FE|nr:hypothetical protein [Candidatus Methylacidiphilum fumarolicum]MBW6414093.1 hypothetical protein [Candidatus Methylacidiphilum fumarolicum]
MAIAPEILDFRGLSPSKELSRHIIQMQTGMLRDRIESLAPAGGSPQEKVNPAYNPLTLFEVRLCPSKEPIRRQVCVPALRVREPCGLGWRIPPQGKDRRLGEYCRGRRETGWMRFFWRGFPAGTGKRTIGNPTRWAVPG